jgi:hypothetical protein
MMDFGAAHNMGGRAAMQGRHIKASFPTLTPPRKAKSHSHLPPENLEKIKHCHPPPLFFF